MLTDESTDNTALENDDLIDEEAVLAVSIPAPRKVLKLCSPYALQQDETDEAILDEPSAQLTSHEDDAALLNPSGNAADQSAG